MKNFSLNTVLFVALGLAQLLSACQQKPLAVPTIVPARTCTLSPGESIPLAATGVEGEEVSYEWSTSGGVITPPTGSTVNFTAPENTKQVIIKVRASHDGKTSESTIVCNIEIIPTPTLTATMIPSPTNTPFPTETLTSTPIPEPIGCQNPSITENVFPWFKDVNGQFSFYGPEDEKNFSCEGVYDVFHSEPMAVHLRFEKLGTNFGWWGIAIKPEYDGFDITTYSEICFWAYTQKPNQAFRLKLRERAKLDKGVTVTIDEANQWQPVCRDLTLFTDQGVTLSRLENINLGFEADIDSAEVWVDDFEFK